MAKKKSASRADAVRDAVDQAFKTQLPRERISELLDEIGSTAGRLRGAVEELRPATESDVRALRAAVEAQQADLERLTARIEALETKPKPAARPRAEKRKPAAKPAGKPAAKSAAKPRAGRKKPPAGEPPASA